MRLPLTVLAVAVSLTSSAALAQAQPAAFGGGDGARDPLVMDATDVIVLH